jgi:hypothetical protein
VDTSRRIHRLGCLYALTFALSLVASAEPITPLSGLDIRSMFGASETVIVGTITDVRLLADVSENRASAPPSRAAKIQEWEATVRVLRVYKGSVASTLRVGFRVQVPAMSVQYGPSLERGESALLFLVNLGSGGYGFANPQWAKFRFSDFQLSNDSETGPELLEKDLAATLAGKGEAVDDALDVLMTFHNISPATEGEVATLSRGPSVRVDAKAFALLLNTGKNQYFVSLAQFLSVNGASVSGEELVAIFSRVQDPGPNADPKVFDELSTLPLPPIKLAAMYALRKIRSPESVPTLMGHLGESDSNLQYLAVITLDDIVQNGADFGPSNLDFDRHPQTYIVRWKQWWDQEGKAKYSP